MLTASSRIVARATLSRSRIVVRRYLSESANKKTKESAASTAAKEETKKKTGWWHSAELWGGLGALAGWGMSGSAIYDAVKQGPEIISLKMTPVLMIYSTLFAYWSWVIIPRNLLLMGCHVANVVAQSNQLRRGLEYKMEIGEEEEVKTFTRNAALGGSALVGSVLLGPMVQRAVVNAEMGVVSKIAAADAGPFTVHFWAPMSKWLISGASFLELDRPTDKISLSQYSALTLTGFFFSRYSLLVIPINYTLCSVNVALFLSSAWHLGRKVKADFID